MPNPPRQVYAFAPRLGTAYGGAERSTFQLIRDRHAGAERVVILSLSFDEGVEDLLPGAQWVEVPVGVGTKLLPYWTYLVNRGRLRRFFAQLDARDAVLVCYGELAPACALGFRGTVHYFFRSESDFGLDVNYHRGLLRVARGIQRFIEAPPRWVFIRDLRRATGGATLFTNSEYMRSECRSRFSREAEVIRPGVDAATLVAQYRAARVGPHRRGVVCSGSAVHKGLGLVKEIAALVPERDFFVFGRRFREPEVRGNLHLLPWSTEPGRVYASAELVIVPSLWNEAYGRVAREAQILGLPVLVSKRGGLPEAVDFDATRIVDDYRNPNAWARRIRSVLGQRGHGVMQTLS